MNGENKWCWFCQGGERVSKDGLCKHCLELMKKQEEEWSIREPKQETTK